MPRIGLIIGMLVLALASCGGDGDAISVVVSAPISTEPWVARSIERGGQLAVDEINAGGGVQLTAEAKQRLKLVVLDNASSPATPLANAREAVSRPAAALLTDGT